MIQVLPALPSEWQSGHIKGLRARGGFEIDIVWEGGELKELKIKSLLGNPCKIKYRDQYIEPEIQRGEEMVLDGSLSFI
jgi:alpha-L-fucosidase 2